MEKTPVNEFEEKSSAVLYEMIENNQKDYNEINFFN